MHVHCNILLSRGVVLPWLLTDEFLKTIKALFDCFLDARLEHYQLALPRPQGVTLSFEKEDLLSEGVVGLKQLLLALLTDLLRLFNLLAAPL